jgi:hypothetical protein
MLQQHHTQRTYIDLGLGDLGCTLIDNPRGKNSKKKLEKSET